MTNEEKPSPLGHLTPELHRERGNDLIRDNERCRRNGWSDERELAEWQADAQLAMAHFWSAMADDQASMRAMMAEQGALYEAEVKARELQANPQRVAGEVTPDRQRAADLAEAYLPDYLGAWIAGALRETHSLPALIQHQGQLAADVIRLLSAYDADIAHGSVLDVTAKLESIRLTRGVGDDLQVYLRVENGFRPVQKVEFLEEAAPGYPRIVVID
jgi:hypothetical protein